MSHLPSHIVDSILAECIAVTSAANFIVDRHHGWSVRINNDQIGLFSGFQTAIQIFIEKRTCAPLCRHAQDIL